MQGWKIGVAEVAAQVSARLLGRGSSMATRKLSRKSYPQAERQELRDQLKGILGRGLEQYPENKGEGMSVDVASCTLDDLFGGRVITGSDGSVIKGNLNLPEYQRPYRWGRNELERLFQDLRRHFDPEGKGGLPAHLFYLGSIILHQDGEERLNIIDGQQRLTTMALMAWLQEPGSEPKLRYASPLSQVQIRENLQWLRGQRDWASRWLDLARINITLVVTSSEDDAYRFFETENTSGVRLSGPNIIKAHHLRAVPRSRQDRFARIWESLGDLDPVVDAVLKTRWWHALDFKDLPSHRQRARVREAVVDELAERTGDGQADVAYGQIETTRTLAGEKLQTAHADGYAIRQPLNAGINTIHYLEYFESLRRKLLSDHQEPGLELYHDFYQNLIQRLEGCSYLKKLYDSSLLTYASHFGQRQLFEAALWLFRVVYSRRVTNSMAVREKSVPSFVQKYPVFDWILMSYSHEQCMERLRAFEVPVNSENLGPEYNGVKKRFVLDVDKWFGLGLAEDRLAETYDHFLKKAIAKKFEKAGVGYG